MTPNFFRMLLVTCLLFLFACDSPYQPQPTIHKDGPIKLVRYAHEAPVSESERKAHPEFHTMMDVLTDKKCVNCHPSDGIPRQGEDSHKHFFGMAGGKDNRGFEAIQCSTCHQDSNNNFAGVPGAPDWSLAPESMKWFDLSRVEIAQSMLTAKTNGRRDHNALMHHLTEHELVLWAWDPGVNAAGVKRVPIAVPKEEYIAAVKSWFKNGAIIPGEAESTKAMRDEQNAKVFAEMRDESTSKKDNEEH